MMMESVCLFIYFRFYYRFILEEKQPATTSNLFLIIIVLNKWPSHRCQPCKKTKAIISSSSSISSSIV